MCRRKKRAHLAPMRSESNLQQHRSRQDQASVKVTLDLAVLMTRPSFSWFDNSTALTPCSVSNVQPINEDAHGDFALVS